MAISGYKSIYTTLVTPVTLEIIGEH